MIYLLFLLQSRSCPLISLLLSSKSPITNTDPSTSSQAMKGPIRPLFAAQVLSSRFRRSSPNLAYPPGQPIPFRHLPGVAPASTPTGDGGRLDVLDPVPSHPCLCRSRCAERGAITASTRQSSQEAFPTMPVACDAVVPAIRKSTQLFLISGSPYYRQPMSLADPGRPADRCERSYGTRSVGNKTQATRRLFPHLQRSRGEILPPLQLRGTPRLHSREVQERTSRKTWEQTRKQKPGIGKQAISRRVHGS